MKQVHIIAEAGTNHNGCLQTAQQLVDVAVAAGADSVKFQIINPSGLYLPALYSNGRYITNEVYQQRAAGALDDDAYAGLAAYCAGKGISFSASVFDTKSLDLVDRLDVPYIKVASCDLNNSRFLQEIAAKGRRIVLSTGMASLGEIERAVNDIVAAGNEDIVLMHCVSMYPCPLPEMNLNFIKTLRESFGFTVGLSDHTEDSLAAAAAIALGAEWIEKHFTLDRKAKGFDHAYALEPEDFIRFVREMRAVAAACSRKARKVSAGEEEVKSRARRSVYAAVDIMEGARLTEKDILVVCPEGPLAPNDVPRLLGRRARRLIRQYEPLDWDLFA